MLGPHSKMTLSKRFETIGSKPAAKVPPKRRHFAAVTEIPETRPSRFSDSAQLKKRRIPKEVRLNLLWARVGGEPTVLNWNLNLKAPLGRRPKNYRSGLTSCKEAGFLPKTNFPKVTSRTAQRITASAAHSTGDNHSPPKLIPSSTATIGLT